MWWHTSVSSAFGKVEQENREFKAILSYQVLGHPRLQETVFINRAIPAWATHRECSHGQNAVSVHYNRSCYLSGISFYFGVLTTFSVKT